MAASATLSKMVRRVRDLANQPSVAAENYASESTDNRFASTMKIVRSLNAALAQLDNKLKLAQGLGRFVKRVTIDVVSDTELYDLPADFQEATHVMHYDGSAAYTPMDEYGVADEAWLRSSSNEYSLIGSPYMYSLTPTQLSLLPVPGTAATGEAIHLRYIPAFVDLERPDDSYDGVNGFEDWACYRAAMEILGMKGDEPAGSLVNGFMILDQQIDDLAGDRGAVATQVQDAEGWW